MHIDISDLLGKRVTEKKVDISFEGKNIMFEGEDISFAEPVNIKGIFKLSGNIVDFSGKLSTVLSLNCSRCLEKFNYP
ncbi:DNA-binding protein, partial [Clostridium botulinum C str. Stockholm]